MDWHLRLEDGSTRDIVYWPETHDLNKFGEIRGGNPILFPFCGRTYANGKIGFWEFEGVRRPMPLHGFVREGTFAIDEIELEEIELSLQNPHEAIDLGRAPAEGLILWSLKHNEFSHEFEYPTIVEEISLPPSEKRAHKQWLNLARMENSSILQRELLRLIKT